MPADAEDVVSNNRMRGELDNAMAALKLFSKDDKLRLEGVKALLKEPDEARLPLVEKALAAEKNETIRTQLELARAAALLGSSDKDRRLEAARAMGQSKTPETNGWHRLHAEISGDAREGATASTTLVVTPRRLELPEAAAQPSRLGLRGAALLRALVAVVGPRRRRRPLRACSWTGRALGADFVLVNPLHAASPIPPMAPSPYLPVTRRFANPIYLRVEDVPEFAYLPEVGRALAPERLALTHTALPGAALTVAISACRTDRSKYRGSDRLRRSSMK